MWKLASKVLIVVARPEHAAALALVMRPEDAAEVRAHSGRTPLEALQNGLDLSDPCFTLMIDDQPAAMFGVAPLHVAGTILGGTDVASVWMLTGTAVWSHPTTFLRLCRPMLRHLLRQYPVLVNAIDARYVVALRWARWLGFTVADPVPFGVEGRPFHFISIRRTGDV